MDFFVVLVHKVLALLWMYVSGVGEFRDAQIIFEFVSENR